MRIALVVLMALWPACAGARQPVDAARISGAPKDAKGSTIPPPPPMADAPKPPNEKPVTFPAGTPK